MLRDRCACCDASGRVELLELVWLGSWDEPTPSCEGHLQLLGSLCVNYCNVRNERKFKDILHILQFSLSSYLLDLKSTPGNYKLYKHKPL